MAAPRVVLSLALILVLVGSSIAQGPAMAPTAVPTTEAPTMAPMPMVVLPAPVEAPMATSPMMAPPPMDMMAPPPMDMTTPTPTASVADMGPSMAPGSAPEGSKDSGAFAQGGSLVLLAVLGGVAIFA